MICSACQELMDPIFDQETQTQKCPKCGHVDHLKTFPLFIVTGASGVGKTAVVPNLRGLLPSWDIFETDIIWDSGGDWAYVWNNWLRIAHSIAKSERPVILSGCVLPETIDKCDSRFFFDPIHYLALHCNDATREARLRARPAWRGWTDKKIEEHKNIAKCFLEDPSSEFESPPHVVDTSYGTVQESTIEIRDWALNNWNTWVANQAH